MTFIPQSANVKSARQNKIQSTKKQQKGQNKMSLEDRISRFADRIDQRLMEVNSQLALEPVEAGGNNEQQEPGDNDYQ